MSANENGGGNPKLLRALEVFGNVFALNVMFIVFSLPVITFGASMTALYSVTLKMARKEEGTIGKSFLESFKKNFKKATQVWLVIIGILFILFVEYLLIINVEGTISSFYLVVIIAELVVLAFILPFLFPLVARYENTFWNYFKNAFLLSVSNFGSWLKIMVAWGLPIFLSLWYPVLFFSTWYLWILLLIALIAYGTSFTMRKVFDRIVMVQESEKARKEEEKAKKEYESKKRLADHIHRTSDIEKEEE